MTQIFELLSQAMNQVEETEGSNAVEKLLTLMAGSDALPEEYNRIAAAIVEPGTFFAGYDSENEEIGHLWDTNELDRLRELVRESAPEHSRRSWVALVAVVADMGY